MAPQSTGMLSHIQAFLARPTVRSGMQSCVIMAVGDITCQSVIGSGHFDKKKVKEEGRSNSSAGSEPATRRKKLGQDGKPGSASPEEEGSQGISYDPSRTARFALIGLTLHGPFFLHGFRWLDTQFGASKTLTSALTKSIAGQVTIFPVYVGLFFAYMGYLEGRRGEEVVEKVKKSFPPTFQTGCAFWPAANIINFMFVPPTSRVLYVNGAGLIWNTYLSWSNARLNALPSTRK